MSDVRFFSTAMHGVPGHWNGGTGRIPLVNVGLIEHTYWTTPNGSAMLNLTSVDNVVVRD